VRRGSGFRRFWVQDALCDEIRNSEIRAERPEFSVSDTPCVAPWWSKFRRFRVQDALREEVRVSEQVISL